MKEMFKGCLSPISLKSAFFLPSAPDLDINTRLIDRNTIFGKDKGLERDAALKNLEGAGAVEDAGKWAESGNVAKKLEVMKQFLSGGQAGLAGRLLLGSAHVRDGDMGSSQGDVEKDGIWTSSEVRKDNARLKPRPKIPVQEPVMKGPSFQGRASEEQSKRAMARLRSAQFVTPAVYLANDSDEDTEDEDAEEERARTAHLLFADPGESSRGPFGMRSSSLASTSSPISARGEAPNVPTSPVHATGKDRKILPGLPLTPTSHRGSQGGFCLDRSLELTSILGKRNRNQQDTDGLRTPPPTKPVMLSPTTPRRKEKRKDTSASPAFMDSLNTTCLSPGEPHMTQRKVVEEATVPVIDFRIKLTQSFRKDIAVSTKTGSVPQRKPVTNRPASSSALKTDRSEIEKRSLTIDRKTLTETIARALPPGLCSGTSLSSQRPFLDRSGSSPSKVSREKRKGVDSCSSSRCGSERLSNLHSTVQPPKLSSDPNSMKIQARRPSQTHIHSPSKTRSKLDFNIQDDMDLQHDTERMRLLAEQYKAEFAKGVRPGLVIPRLACLDSEDEEDSD